MRHLVSLLGLGLLAAGCVETSDADEVETDSAWGGGKADGQGTSGALRITEVESHPTDAANAFIEVINRSDAPVDLATCTLSVGRNKLSLAAIAGRDHIVQPQQLAVIVGPTYDSASSTIPGDAALVSTVHDLGGNLAKSQRLIVRIAGAQSDKADASVTTAPADTSLERDADDDFVVSALGQSPGEQNAINAKAIDVYFANPPVDTTDPIAPHLVTVIDGAQHTLDAAFFQVDHPAVIQAFVRAKQRGVAIRFVTDADYFNDPNYTAGYQTLVAAGIPVVPDKRSAFMHSKFMVVDGQTVWTGSYNLLAQDRATFDHADNVLYIRSKQLAVVHTEQFEQLFAGVFGNAKKDAGHHDVFVDGYHFEVYFGPQDHLRDHVVAALGKSSQSVHFLMFSFFQKDVGTLLIDESHRGVDVRGVFDVSSKTSAGSQYAPFVAAGLDMRAANPDGPGVFLHDKIFVIDSALPTATVITGSPNTSDSAYGSNDEAMYIIHDRAIAAKYEATYHVFYDRSVGPNQH
jgi:phosphatidylserine/phosphatidylglycerophosphate/cardiolipin synthase-like enzyme